MNLDHGYSNQLNYSYWGMGVSLFQRKQRKDF